MKVGIVGGTGDFGRALAQRLTALELPVAIGSRDSARARELAAVYGVEGGSNADVVAEADFVVLAVQSGAAIATARALAEPLGSTPLLCVASDLRFTKEGVLPGRLGRSLAEEVADAVQGPVASGLQSLAAVHLTRQDPPEQDVLICGDDPLAKEPALDLGGRLVPGRAIDVGPLANARALEGLTSVILNVNRRYKTHAAIRLTGFP